MSKLAIQSICLAIASVLATCQSAVLVADQTTAATTEPATQPVTTQPVTTQPVTQPIQTFSFPLDSAPTDPAPINPAEAIYTTSPAPATVHVNALNLSTQPTDWLTQHFTWNFGDKLDPTLTSPVTAKTIHLNHDLPGPVAAYEYENPGTYSITLTRTVTNGQLQTFTRQIIVPPSARKVFFIAANGSDHNSGTDVNHPLQSASAALARLADHTEFRFRRGDVYTLQPEFPMKHHDLLIDCYGNQDLPLPVFKRTPPATMAADDAMVFTTWPGATADITIRHLRIDSPWTPAATVDGYAYHAPTATFGILRGTNITIANCEFNNLEEGPHGDPTASGLLLLHNTQVDPLGIPSRTLWLEGHNVIAIGNTATNSIGESPLRAAATGVTNGLFAFNNIAQQLDPAHNRATAKAAITLRTMQDVTVSSNRITNAEFSFDPHTSDVQDQHFIADSNAVINSMIDIKTNVRHAIFSNNTIQRDGGPCFTISPGNGESTDFIQDLQLLNNTGTGWLDNGRMIQINTYLPQQLRGFVYDTSKNPYTRLATTQPSY